ncbi:putative protein Mlo2p [[Candida] railenensis]|uniref:UBR-type domain-containing protein n=1 Tax=[Candida] railenensis TaxID=45579 RepID=A0A9P0QQY8_9ASCO|nr:putative protein Mlo2p [[Candida] railenensis]
MSTITAGDYIQSQLELEREARELMPYDSNVCTYSMGELRQPIFACLTCSRQNKGTPIGVCYSCSIQCHSSHEIVELFAKRSFVCDCGTTKMKDTIHGACKIRSKPVEEQSHSNHPSIRRSSSSSFNSRPVLLEAEDIPSSGNQYNQNFKGLFCSCEKTYNPLEETGNMIQCFFGYECSEEWYHEGCILGYLPGAIKRESTTKPSASSSQNQLEKLALPTIGEEAPKKREREDQSEDENEEDNEGASQVPYFPNLNDFDQFICWKCVNSFKQVFNYLVKHDDIALTHLPHYDNIPTIDEWKLKYNNTKKIKVENSDTVIVPYSVFLKPGFKACLKRLHGDTSSPKYVQEFLTNYSFLYEEDPVYEPPEDEDDDTSSNTGSLLDLGAEALSSLPKEQAIEGLQAYDKIKEKLRDFFKPFAEDGKVVTEDEVRSFFNKVKEEER